MSQTSESGDHLGVNKGKENVVVLTKQTECFRDGFRGRRLILGDVSNRLGKRGFSFESRHPLPEKGNGFDRKLKTMVEEADSLRNLIAGREIGSEEKGKPASMPSGDPSDGDDGGSHLFNVMQPFGSVQLVNNGIELAQNKEAVGVTQAPDDSRTFASSLNVDLKGAKCTAMVQGAAGGDESGETCTSSVSLSAISRKANEFSSTAAADVCGSADPTMVEDVAGTDFSNTTLPLDASGNNNEGSHVVASVQSLTSNDLNFQFVDSQESVVTCGTEFCQEVLTDFIHSRTSGCRTLDFGVVKPQSCHANEERLSANIGLDFIKNCTCSFCLKAAFVLSELHYQDFKGRLGEVKRSIRQVRQLIERGYYQGVTEECTIGEASSNQPKKLESDLMHQWKALFLHTENALVCESSQLQSSLKKLKVVSDNCKKDFEMTKGASFRNS